jgi:hypothetical protein
MGFLPVLGYLGVRNIYFCGVDNLPHTGHFWDRERVYQDLYGMPLRFPAQQERLALCHEKAMPFLSRHDIHVYRLEKDETLLQSYPYMDFEEALARSEGTDSKS